MSLILNTDWCDLETFSSNNSVGTEPWDTPSNARLSDDAHADTGAMTPSEVSEYLVGLKLNKAGQLGVQPDIPLYAHIVGIEVRREGRSASSQKPNDSSIRLFVASSPVGDNKSAGAAWTATDAIATYGGASDLWGLTTLTAETVLSSGFGFGISIVNPSGSVGTDGKVDHMQMKIYYDPSRFFLAL